ncbi:spore coat protein [Paenibacillus hamazuiensis]|uniref:spore coat protein n=1 Tax=Paenibacillus hamazuiensis TaxID=2936508 RepID=UPI00200ED4D1|nr:spore coat protein [Paenibacillus hamazuiensis]
MFTQQQQQNNGITTKELAYITDSLKNEELLAKLCVQGAMEAQTPQLKQTFSQLAQERLHNADQLIRALQMQSGFSH